MPVRNGAAYVEHAIASILGQTLGDFEFIVVDDGSSDGTLEIVRSFAAKDMRIRALDNGDKPGLVNALEAGRLLVRGQFIARMDADDIAHPERLALQHDFLGRHPEVVVVGGQVDKIDRFGRNAGRARYPVDDAACRRHLRLASPFCHPATVIRAEPLAVVGGYRHRFHAAEDYDLWLRLSKVGALANLSDPVLHYRAHDANLSRTNANANAIAAALALLEDIYPGCLAGLENELEGRGTHYEVADWLRLERVLPEEIRIYGRTAYLRALTLGGVAGRREGGLLLRSLPAMIADAMSRNAGADLRFFLSRAAYQRLRMIRTRIVSSDFEKNAPK